MTDNQMTVVNHPYVAMRNRAPYASYVGTFVDRFLAKFRLREVLPGELHIEQIDHGEVLRIRYEHAKCKYSCSVAVRELFHQSGHGGRYFKFIDQWVERYVIGVSLALNKSL